MTDALPITALIATIRGWPAAKPALEHLVQQTIAAGGEVIVAGYKGTSTTSGGNDDAAVARVKIAA